MDRILISDLAARCIIGVDDEERNDKQSVLINLTLFTDIAPAAHSDRLADALDYRRIRSAVVSMVEGSSFFLLEALAEAIAAVCLKERRVEKVRVRVDKPGALRFARSVAVEIERERVGG